VPYRARRGGAPSEHGSTASGMVLRCLGWGHRVGDGRTGSEVMEKTRSTHLVSRRCVGQAPGWWTYASQGRRCPFSRGAAWRKDRSGWHSVEK
jgi:hypothetical protein